MGITRLLQVSDSRIWDFKSSSSLWGPSDSVQARTLTTGVGVNGDVTIEKCTEACFNAGMRLAGAEFAE
jgi:hypothetical protein